MMEFYWAKNTYHEVVVNGQHICTVRTTAKVKKLKELALIFFFIQ